MTQSGAQVVAQVAIIIPALNEAATIAQVVQKVAAYGQPIVVNDGSQDATAELARKAGAIVVSHAENRGYDRALASGFAQAAQMGFAFAITIDADGQHNPGQLREYIQLLQQGHDLVLGARDRLQRFSEYVFAWVGRAVWRVPDPLCGMKGYHMRLYAALGHFDSFESIGTELAIRAVASKVNVAHTAVITRDRLDAPRFARRLRANFKILRALAILLGLQLRGRLAIKELTP
ncbi:glycosyltransferase family 2 protein [Massilia sp. W12]|uniref:glycosyltransferase family 2 protein n=1 Tax=Massilia sp. W12 TaxID=3126507 RepID=UPI0030D527DE